MVFVKKLRFFPIFFLPKWIRGKYSVKLLEEDKPF